MENIVSVDMEQNDKIIILKNRYKGIVSILISTLGFSVIPIFARLGLKQGYSSSLLLFYRFLFAFFIFYFYLKLTKYRITSDKKMIKKICIIGIIYSLQCLCYFSAFQYISVSLGAIIYNTYPIFTILFSKFFLRTTITFKMILGVILAILGSTFVIYSPMTENKLLGILLVILTTIFSGAYMVYTKKFLNTVNSLELTTYVSLICSITLFGISFFSGTFVILTDLSTLLYVLILAFFSTVIGLLGFMKAISYLDVGLVSIINLIEPFFTVTISYILFKDTLTLLQLIGGFIIVLGVYFYEK